MNKLKKIGTLEFVGEIFEDNSFSRTSLGVCKNDMTFYALDGHHFIEWCVDDIAEAQIGLTINDKEVIDYDGVFDLPKEAVELIEKCGYTVSQELKEHVELKISEELQDLKIFKKFGA